MTTRLIDGRPVTLTPRTAQALRGAVKSKEVKVTPLQRAGLAALAQSARSFRVHVQITLVAEARTSTIQNIRVRSVKRFFVPKRLRRI
jgi:hypothetical protein